MEMGRVRWRHLKFRFKIPAFEKILTMGIYWVILGTKVNWSCWVLTLTLFCRRFSSCRVISSALIIACFDWVSKTAF